MVNEQLAKEVVIKDCHPGFEDQLWQTNPRLLNLQISREL